jgi:hypothetical protein
MICSQFTNKFYPKQEISTVYFLPHSAPKSHGPRPATTATAATRVGAANPLWVAGIRAAEPAAGRSGASQRAGHQSGTGAGACGGGAGQRVAGAEATRGTVATTGPAAERAAAATTTGG